LHSTDEIAFLQSQQLDKIKHLEEERKELQEGLALFRKAAAERIVSAPSSSQTSISQSSSPTVLPVPSIVLPTSTKSGLGSSNRKTSNLEGVVIRKRKGGEVSSSGECSALNKQDSSAVKKPKQDAAASNNTIKQNSSPPDQVQEKTKSAPPSALPFLSGYGSGSDSDSE
jgi:cell division septum initiation protein DivIVA